MLRGAHHTVFLLASIGWMGVIFHFSSLPGKDMPLLFPGQDKLIHLVIYGILGFLLTGAVRTALQGYRTRPFWFVVVLVALYGISDEIHQIFVPGRTADVFDVIANAAGGLLGAGMMVIMARLMRLRSVNHTK